VFKKSAPERFLAVFLKLRVESRLIIIWGLVKMALTGAKNEQ